jgi:hypothetical protein
MERLDRAPASDAVPASPWGCRRTFVTANCIRCGNMNVPIASLISTFTLASELLTIEIVRCCALRGNHIY